MMRNINKSIAELAAEGGPVAPTQRAMQAHKQQSGAALRGHVNSAHKGLVDPKCNACKELQAKMDAW